MVLLSVKENQKKNTILVVDDVPDNIHVLVGSLEKDCRIKIATGGEAALKVTMATPPDLILLDVTKTCAVWAIVQNRG